MGLPHGALRTVRDVSIDEPFCWLSTAQSGWCLAHGYEALVAHLPCWIPQQHVSLALYGSMGLGLVAQTTAEHGPWVWATEFSNVHTTFAFDEPGFTLDGARYAGPEVFFQLAKSEGTDDHTAAREAIARDPSPENAFVVGRTHAMRADWEAVKVSVMRRALTAKFTQSPALTELLRATRPHPLVQVKAHDAFWGTGPDGRGLNMLGRLLMQLRETL